MYICGGNLLEIDEERKTIHFIHHGVLLHLTDSDPSSSVAWSHFDLEDTELHMGFYLCYLSEFQSFRQTNFKILANQVTSGQITNRVITAATKSCPWMEKTVRHSGSRRRGTGYNIVVSKVMQDIIQSMQKNDYARSFLLYASSNWVQHTRQFHPMTTHSVWILWRNLLQDEFTHAEVPWHGRGDHEARFHWAMQNCHTALFLNEMQDDTIKVTRKPETIMDASGGDWQRVSNA